MIQDLQDAQIDDDAYKDQIKYERKAVPKSAHAERTEFGRPRPDESLASLKRELDALNAEMKQKM